MTTDGFIYYQKQNVTSQKAMPIMQDNKRDSGDSSQRQLFLLQVCTCLAFFSFCFQNLWKFSAKSFILIHNQHESPHLTPNQRKNTVVASILYHHIIQFCVELQQLVQKAVPTLEATYIINQNVVSSILLVV